MHVIQDKYCHKENLIHTKLLNNEMSLTFSSCFTSVEHNVSLGLGFNKLFDLASQSPCKPAQVWPRGRAPLGGDGLRKLA